MVTRRGIEVLADPTATVDLTMSPSTLAFNLFDHANHGACDQTETSRNFGKPIAGPTLSYATPSVQLVSDCSSDLAD